MKKYYVRVNRGNGVQTEAYSTKIRRDKVVSWEYGRAVSYKEARKLDKFYFDMISESEQPLKTF